MFAPRESRNRQAPSAWPWTLGMLVLPVVALVSFGPARQRLIHPDAAITAVAVVIGHDHLQMPDSVTAGMVEFEVTNNDSVAHGLAVRAAGTEKPIATLDEPVQPGGSAKQQVPLDAGSYEVYCPDAGTALTHGLTVVAKQTPSGLDR